MRKICLGKVYFGKGQRGCCSFYVEKLLYLFYLYIVDFGLMGGVGGDGIKVYFISFKI